jgi:hypothetical protein
MKNMKIGGGGVERHMDRSSHGITGGECCVGVFLLRHPLSLLRFCLGTQIFVYDPEHILLATFFSSSEKQRAEKKELSA